MDPLSIEVMAILTIRNLEVDLEADHLVDLAVLLPQVTESILVTGFMPTTGVEIKTIGQIMVHIIVMIVTGTVLAMADAVMTDMTSVTANIMTWVMTGGMTTEVDTGLHVGILLVDLQTISGLMTAVQTT